MHLLKSMVLKSVMIPKGDGTMKIKCLRNPINPWEMLSRLSFLVLAQS